MCRCENQALLYMCTCTLLSFYNYPWAMLKKKQLQHEPTKNVEQTQWNSALYCNFNLLTYILSL